jgi:Tol biopolymer transport system component
MFFLRRARILSSDRADASDPSSSDGPPRLSRGATRRGFNWAGIPASLLIVAACSGSPAPAAPSAARSAAAVSAVATSTPSSPVATVPPSVAPSPSASVGIADLPSHGRIAFNLEFVSGSGTSFGLDTIEPDGSSVVNLTAGTRDNAGAPSWTPDGSHLLFGLDYTPRRPSVLVDATNPTASHIVVSNPGWSDQRLLTHGAVFDDLPIVSPDGKTVAFARHLPSGANSIETVPIDGASRPRQVLALSARDDIEGLTMSPDGRTLAFALNGGLFTINIDGSERRRLLPDDAGVLHPSWSPDGAHILFGNPDRTTQADGREIRIVNADGSGLANLTDEKNENFAYDPTWSPDGSMIAFAQFQHGTGYIALVVARADGSAPVAIWHTDAFTDTFIETPAWGTAP